jgi:hypothetical protein
MKKINIDEVKAANSSYSLRLVQVSIALPDSSQSEF